jgi:hypothetical protein
MTGVGGKVAATTSSAHSDGSDSKECGAVGISVLAPAQDGEKASA